MPTNANPISRRYVGDRRILLILGRAFALQAGHPVVAAGIAQHSTFVQEPWTRFGHSLNALLASVNGPSPELTATAIRQLHQQIKGVDSTGKRYHALHPEAYFWVLATTLESIVVMADRFARPMSASELDQFYDEWRQLGRLLGLRDRDMPPDWPAFQRYYTDMLDSRVQDNEVVHQVLDMLAQPPSPHAWPLELLWRGLGPMAGHLLSLTTLGTVPPEIRTLWGIPWTEAQELELRIISNAVRITEFLPGSLGRFRAPRQPWQSGRAAAIDNGTHDSAVAPANGGQATGPPLAQQSRTP